MCRNTSKTHLMSLDCWIWSKKYLLLRRWSNISVSSFWIRYSDDNFDGIFRFDKMQHLVKRDKLRSKIKETKNPLNFHSLILFELMAAALLNKRNVSGNNVYSSIWKGLKCCFPNAKYLGKRPKCNHFIPDFERVTKMKTYFPTWFSPMYVREGSMS